MNDDALYVIHATIERYDTSWWCSVVLRQTDDGPPVSERVGHVEPPSGAMYARLLNWVNQAVHEAALVLLPASEPPR